KSKRPSYDRRRPTREFCLDGAHPPLLRGYAVEFARPFLIKHCAFGLVAAAPMLVTARDEEEIAGPDALFACLILIQIGAFDDHDGNVVCVRVHARIESGIELSKCCMWALVH